jgi:RNA polymerase sigma-70 factor (ECF subfamily)
MASDRVATNQNGQPSPPVTSRGVWNDLVKLVEDHHASLYRYAYRLSGTAADAEDLTQQVFLVAQQKLDQVGDSDCVRGWLFAVLRNCYLRSKRRPRPIAAASLALDMDQLPERITDDEIDREKLQSAINELPDEFKLVVLMFYFEDRSYREIAQELALPIGTVMSRLSRAKGHLRSRLLPDDKDQIDVSRRVSKLSVP